MLFKKELTYFLNDVKQKMLVIENAIVRQVTGGSKSRKNNAFIYVLWHFWQNRSLLSKAMCL